VKVWYALLKDCDYKLVADAVGKWIQTSKYPPSIAELRAAADEKKELPAPKVSPEMEEYFAKIRGWWADMDEQEKEIELQKEMGIYELTL